MGILGGWVGVGKGWGMKAPWAAVAPAACVWGDGGRPLEVLGVARDCGRLIRPLSGNMHVDLARVDRGIGLGSRDLRTLPQSMPH